MEYEYIRANHGKKYQTIDNLHRAPTINPRDQRSGNSPPRIGQRESDAQEGEPGVVALESGGVAHLRQGKGVGVEAFHGGGVVGRGVGVGDVVFFGHGGGGGVDGVDGLWCEMEG